MTEWPMVRLADLCTNPKSDIVDGPFGSNLKRSDYVSDGFPILKIQNVKEHGILLKKINYVTTRKFKELSRHSFRDGDIVITKLGDPLGIAALVSEIGQGLIVADLVRIRANPNKVSTQYLAYCINSEKIRRWINSHQKGTTRPRVTLKLVRDMPIPLPPLDEQKRIVAKLDEVGEKTDSLCEEHLQKLVHLETLKFRFLEDQLTFSDTASQSVILGDLIKVKHGFAFKSEFFQTKGNAEILTPGHFFESGGFRPRVGKEKYYSGEFPEEFKLCGGDLVVVMTEQAPGLLGSPVVIPSDKKYLHNQRIGLIQPKGPIDLPFLACVFNLPRVRAQLASTATGTMVRHTSPSRIEALEVDIPVDIDVQSRVAGRLAHFSKMAGEFEKVSLDRVTLTRKLSQRASTAAFAGEL
ncbi:restriction endonuclease subunit S [bacterium]|nr:restriction endonuclease subunit S [bacterium]